MGLTADELKAIGAAAAEALRAHAEDEVESQIGRRFKTKFELMFGVNCEDEGERSELRRDMEFLRSARQGKETLGRRIAYAFGTLVAAGALYLAALGVKAKIE